MGPQLLCALAHEAGASLKMEVASALRLVQHDLLPRLRLWDHKLVADHALELLEKRLVFLRCHGAMVLGELLEELNPIVERIDVLVQHEMV